MQAVHVAEGSRAHGSPATANRALRAGLETYALETALGAQPDQAVAAAITAGARVHETAVLHRIARAAELVAASLLAEPGGRYSSHAAAITWFAGNHILALPALADAGRYQPVPGDVIEVTLTGAVLAADSAGTWILADETTGCLLPVRGARQERSSEHARPGQGTALAARQPRPARRSRQVNAGHAEGDRGRPTSVRSLGRERVA